MSDADGISQIQPALVHNIADKMGSKAQSRWEGKQIGLWQVIDSQQATINELASTVTDLTEQVEELQAALSNDDYQKLTREQKRLRIKKLVQRAAEENRGKGAVTYKEIRAAFNKQMPKGTPYHFMEQIAKEKGYKYEKRDNADNILKVDLSETEQRLFSSEQ